SGGRRRCRWFCRGGRRSGGRRSCWCRLASARERNHAGETGHAEHGPTSELSSGTVCTTRRSYPACVPHVPHRSSSNQGACILVSVRESVNRPLLLLTAGAIAVAVTSACVFPGEPTASQDRVPTSIDVIPPLGFGLERGEAYQFRAIVRRHREALPDGQVIWSANPPGRAIDHN